MSKIIQPLSDPDDIRDEAEESTKEQYADFYIDQPAPDPLTFHPNRAEVTNPEPPAKTAEEEYAELVRQNDPLRDQ